MDPSMLRSVEGEHRVCVVAAQNQRRQLTQAITGKQNVGMEKV